jgi:hypothetical protein
VSLVYPVLLGVCLGLVLGGRLEALAELPLRKAWLFLVALSLQVVAFPFAALPWTTSDQVATPLWLASYGLLLAGAVLNRHIVGVPVVAAGMLLNLVAILANQGTMPVLHSAMRAAGRTDAHQANSTALSDPSMPWLVDRWAAPDWIPLANVFSVGDVVIAVGALAVVVAGTGVRPPAGWVSSARRARGARRRSRALSSR